MSEEFHKASESPPKPADFLRQGNSRSGTSEALRSDSVASRGVSTFPGKQPEHIDGQFSLDDALQGVVTPSGLEVFFEAKPKRRYLLRKCCCVAGGDICNAEWQEVPSVTEILGVLDKPALPWWGMKVGVEGVTTLRETDKFFQFNNGLHIELLRDDGSTWLAPATNENIVQALTDYKLTVNHQRDKAGERGVSVHDAMENWARLGTMPDPREYPEEEFGYVAALRSLLDQVPFKPVAAEVMVGSLAEGYAGRYDLRATLAAAISIQINRRRKIELSPGAYLLDLKSSKSIYASHELQLAAYEGASVECGYGATDHQLVVQVGADGKFDLRLSRATMQDFLAVRKVYAVMESLRGVA